MLPRVLPIALVLVLLGCGHTEPFAGVELPDGLLPAAPLRMTYSGSRDLLQGHAPTREVFYQYCPDSPSPAIPICTTGERCVGALPAAGGQRTISICPADLHRRDSVRVIGAASRGGDGSLIWSYAALSNNASFALAPTVYLRRPGAFVPQRVVTLQGSAGNPNFPDRFWWVDDHTVFARTPVGGYLITLHDDRAADVATVGDPVDGVDGGLGRYYRVTATGIAFRDAPSGAEEAVDLPFPSGWGAPIVHAVSAWEGKVAAIESGLLNPDNPATRESRLVYYDPETARETELARENGTPWQAISLEPGQGSIVVQRLGPGGPGEVQSLDLFRYEIP